MFERGRVYHRTRELHSAVGGQRYGGISTPTGSHVVLLFTGDEGTAFGYEDGWQADGVFHYSGEGQVGDQVFKRGNKATRDHAVNGRELHLFEKMADTQYRYEGEFVYSGFHMERRPDRTGAERDVIMFELYPLESVAANDFPPDVEVQTANLSELRAIAVSSGGATTTGTSRIAIVRRRSAAVARYARLRSGGLCEACGEAAPFQTAAGEPFLEVHHLRRLSDGGPDHPRWVAAVCPNCHRRAHHAADSASFNSSLIDSIGAIESSA